MKIKVRVHIGNRSMQRGDAHPHIEIEDVASGIKIGDIEFTPAAFGELIAGNGFIEGEMEAVGLNGYKNVGLKKEVRVAFIPKSKIPKFQYSDKYEEAKFIDNLMMYSDHLPEGNGWMVWDNGTRSQQPGDNRRVVYYRYLSENTTGNEEHT